MGGPFTDSLFRAIADYTVMFPDVGSLGTSNATWIVEYNRVRGTAFAAVLLTSNSQEGGGTAGGQRNFSQEVLLDALHCRRYDLNHAYVLPPHLDAYPEAIIARRQGGRPRVIRFSPSC